MVNGRDEKRFLIMKVFGAKIGPKVVLSANRFLTGVFGVSSDQTF